jgi:di/tricarboxylate transporter
MAPWSLFSVTPIGVALVVTGIAYFVLAGRYVLPVTDAGVSARSGETLQYFRDTYGLDYELHEAMVPPGSPLVGRTIDQLEREDHVRVVAVCLGADELRVGASGLDRDLGVQAGSVLGLLGSLANIRVCAERRGLQLRPSLEAFGEPLSPARAGIAEIVIPPGSQLIGKSARDVWMRRTYGIAMMAVHRQGHTLREGEGIRDLPLQAGDMLVVHTPWNALARLETDRNFVVVTTEYPHEDLRPHKVPVALAVFAVTLGLVLFSDLRLSVALMTGAVAMILAGVLRIEEAYQAVSWKSVFLLASLIPLGLAVETSGTARWIAEQTLGVVGGTPTWVIQAAVAVLATAFTLVMSNVGATVLLVPLAVNIAMGVGADPAVFALTVALSTSNSFLIPTHQVNALIMGPGGYGVRDFLRAGGIMTVLFLVVSLAMLNLVF